MKITVWMATRERATWISAAEVVVLALLLLFWPERAIRLMVGVPLLIHLGINAMTSLPMGEVPGRPDGVKRERRNRDLRYCVAGFLSEVRRVEEYAQRAKTAGWSRKEVAGNMRLAQKKIMAAAAEVARATGRSTSDVPDGTAEAGADTPRGRYAGLKTTSEVVPS